MRRPEALGHHVTLATRRLRRCAGPPEPGASVRGRLRSGALDGLSPKRDRYAFAPLAPLGEDFGGAVREIPPHRCGVDGEQATDLLRQDAKTADGGAASATSLATRRSAACSFEPVDNRERWPGGRLVSPGRCWDSSFLPSDL